MCKVTKYFQDTKYYFTKITRIALESQVFLFLDNRRLREGGLLTARAAVGALK